MRLYQHIRPALFRLPPEVAHAMLVRGLEMGGHILPTRPPDSPALNVSLWGKQFANPIGVAAGLDKNGQAFNGLMRLGFGFVEIGTVTPRPQSGNPRPRLFRLVEEEAIINHLGFNNHGSAAVHRRLAGQKRLGCLGVNIGANKDSSDFIADYVAGARRFRSRADYLTVNVSSPNTPRLRDLQAADRLGDLLAQVKQAARTTPILVKLAPDIAKAKLGGIVEAIGASGADGIIISNTTTARDMLAGAGENYAAGGLSGRPLMDKSTAMLAAVHRLTGGTIPLIGVGGVASAEDAYMKIRNGAHLVQLYTALTYQGPGLAREIKDGLTRLMQRDGVAQISDAVGVDVKSPRANKPQAKKPAPALTIWHNPRCSKSRATLALIEAAGCAVNIIPYLDTPPSKAALTRTLKQLGLAASDIIRSGEPLYRELQLAGASKTALIAAMAANPILIERPIVLHADGRAIIGRPPENVLPLLR